MLAHRECSPGGREQAWGLSPWAQRDQPGPAGGLPWGSEVKMWGSGARDGLSLWFPRSGDSNGLMPFRQPAHESL